MAETTKQSQKMPGGGDCNPDLRSNVASIQNFQNMRLGLSIHWGPSSLGGKEISWSRERDIPKKEYDSYYKNFNPIHFDANEWVQLAADNGMKYILPTSKHHDGFSLWPSKYSQYNIQNTPFGRDVVGELAAACRQRNIVFGSYYSLLDWGHPDYQPYDHGGPVEDRNLFHWDEETPNFQRYLGFMKNQLRELIVDYGAEIIQFDGEWDHTWNHRLGSDLYRYLRGLNDKVLVSSRVDVGRDHLHPKTGMWDWSIYAGDFDERERIIDSVEGVEQTSSENDGQIFGKSDNPWQAWVTIDQAQWSWNACPKLLSAPEIIIDLVKTIGDGGNYLLNLGPMPDGAFEPDQVHILQEVGSWIKKYSEAIYATTAGPFFKVGQFTSTRSAKQLYLFVFDHNLEQLRLPLHGMELGDVRSYSGESLDFDFSASHCSITLPKNCGESVRVLRLHILG